MNQVSKFLELKKLKITYFIVPVILIGIGALICLFSFGQINAKQQAHKVCSFFF